MLLFSLSIIIVGVASVCGVESVAVAVGTNAFAGGNSAVSSVANAVRVGVQVATGHGEEGLLSSFGITNNAGLALGTANATYNSINHPTPAPAAHAPTPAPAAHAPAPAPTVNYNRHGGR